MYPSKKNRRSDVLVTIVIYTIKFLATVISKLKKDRIWLIGCGGERWGDNAHAIWHFLNFNCPEIKAIAVVKKEEDLPGKHMPWIKRNKMFALLLLFMAEVFLVTHSLNDIGPQRFTDLAKAKTVRLQHGVFGIKKMPVSGNNLDQFDMICASSLKEKKIMTGDLGLSADTVRITGLARHDYLRLKSNTRKGDGILYMPTFRDWVNEEEKNIYKEMLLSWIEEYTAVKGRSKVKVWLHPNWYKVGFDIEGLPGVAKVDLKQDLQDLLIESELFITDYSSAAFDAGLIGLPVVFFQPDRQLYIECRGLYDGYMEQEGLLVVNDSRELILAVEKLLTDKVCRDKRVAKGQEWAYKYVETYDGHACERICGEINSLLIDN